MSARSLDFAEVKAASFLKTARLLFCRLGADADGAFQFVGDFQHF